MSNQQLIYETAVPVSFSRHGKVSVDMGTDRSFCRHLNSVPLMAAEFASAASEYTIVFAEGGEAVMPVVVLGVRSQQNLFIDSAGHWKARYVPAFVRRYPFVFSTEDEGKSFTLCVDEGCQGVNYRGQGQALFGADGKPSAYTNSVLQFLQEYRVQFTLTQSFGNHLKELGLLEPMQAQFTLGTGEKASLTGFLCVNRDKLKALPADELAKLAASDELELAYMQLASMRNFNILKEMLAESSVVTPAAEASLDQPAAADAETVA